jgi:hypothetical protein
VLLLGNLQRGTPFASVALKPSRFAACRAVSYAQFRPRVSPLLLTSRRLLVQTCYDLLSDTPGTADNLVIVDDHGVTQVRTPNSPSSSRSQPPSSYNSRMRSLLFAGQGAAQESCGQRGGELSRVLSGTHAMHHTQGPTDGSKLTRRCCLQTHRARTYAPQRRTPSTRTHPGRTWCSRCTWRSDPAQMRRWVSPLSPRPLAL